MYPPLTHSLDNGDKKNLDKLLILTKLSKEMKDYFYILHSKLLGRKRYKIQPFIL